MNVSQIKSEICRIGRLLHERGYIAAADGNISYKLDDNRVLITSSGKHKAFLDENMISMVDLTGERISGSPSSETAVHVAIYRETSMARAVIHAHPPHCIAWSIAHPNDRELPLDAMPEVLLGIGKAPIVAYQTPGSPHLAENIARFAETNRVLIMARHGVIAWGENLMEAYMGIERVEHAAKVLTLAQNLGEISSLTSAEITRLGKIRSELGPQTR